MIFPFPRRTLRRLFRLRSLLIILVLLFFLDAYNTTSSIPEPVRVSKTSPSYSPKTIFLASIFRNSEYILRTSWMPALYTLIQDIGAKNIYVSIIESGSFDDTKVALGELEAALNSMGVGNRILVGMTGDEQMEMLQNVPDSEDNGGDRSGWIFTGRYKKIPSGWERRRIPWLAEQRNKAMEPLMEMQPGRTFEKVLWVNDVIFTTEDVLTLLSTNNASYSAACSLDFSKSDRQYYDTFALRDSNGHRTASLSWPYFFQSSSRASLLAGQPAPVKSCWNGMVAFDAMPFYHGLGFRGIEDSLARFHLEGSESCLVHADNYRARDAQGIFVNPHVRVSYNNNTYARVNQVVGEGEGGRRRWPGNWEAVIGMWKNRWGRLKGVFPLWSADIMVKRRVDVWTRRGKFVNDEREEKARECLINEMQVLVENGWQHV